MKGIDWALLRTQKISLLYAINISPPVVAEDLTGILHLIDYLQDEAACDPDVGEAVVYGDDV